MSLEENKKIDQYGVWIKKSPQVDEKKDDDNSNIEDLLEKDISFAPVSNEEESQEKSIDEAQVKETSQEDFSNLLEQNKDDVFEEEISSIIDDETEKPKTDEMEEVSFDDFSDGDIDLSAFLSDDSSSGGSTEINVDDFLGATESFHIDNFLGESKPKEEAIFEDETLDIELVFDDSFSSDTVSNPTDDIEVMFSNGNGDSFDTFDVNEIFNETEAFTDETKTASETAVEPAITQKIMGFEEANEFDDLLSTLDDIVPSAVETDKDENDSTKPRPTYNISVRVDDEIEDTQETDNKQTVNEQTESQEEEDLEDIPLFLGDERSNKRSDLEKKASEDYNSTVLTTGESMQFEELDDILANMEIVGGSKEPLAAETEDFPQDQEETKTSEIENSPIDEDFDNSFEMDMENSNIDETNEAQEDAESNLSFEDAVLESDFDTSLDEESKLDDNDSLVESIVDESLIEDSFVDESIVDEPLIDEDKENTNDLLEDEEVKKKGTLSNNENTNNEIFFEDDLEIDDEVFQLDDFSNTEKETFFDDLDDSIEVDMPEIEYEITKQGPSNDEISFDISSNETKTEMTGEILETDNTNQATDNYDSDALDTIDEVDSMAGISEHYDNTNNEVDNFDQFDTDSDLDLNMNIDNSLLDEQETSIASQNDDKELLKQIASEITSLRNEIFALKQELANKTETIVTQEEQPASNGFFSSTEEDEVIALSGDELNNILINADFTQESPLDASEDQEDFQDEAEISLDQSEDQEDFQDEAEISLDESEDQEDFQDETEISLDESEAQEDFQDETEISLDESEDQKDFQDETEISLDESEDQFDIENNQEDFFEENLVEPSDEELDINTIVSNNEEEIDEIAMEQTDLVVSSADTDLLEVPFDTENQDTPEPMDSELEDIAEFEEEIEEPLIDDEEESEDSDSFNEPTQEVFNSDQWNIQEDLQEDTINKETASPSEEKKDKPSIIQDKHIQEEIKSVLIYMDQLLESLPEEKIEEFAKSENFAVYKKLFSELGLL